MSLEKNLFCFGLGYTASILGGKLIADGWEVGGSTRKAQKAAELEQRGFRAVVFGQDQGQDRGQDRGQAQAPDKSGENDVDTALRRASHILVSIPPGRTHDATQVTIDPVLGRFKTALALKAAHIRWIGYLSTIGVYGEHNGEWVDETAETRPVTERSSQRLSAEKEWLDFGRRSGIPVQIFRLPGIYGPKRNQLESIRNGKARRLVKEGQVFNRIHVEDIATVIASAMQLPVQGEIFNLSDDEPAPPQDVVAYAADLLGTPPPPVVNYEEAELSPMARSFYGECKRVRNNKIKDVLGVSLKYPTYREGLEKLARDMNE